MSLQQRFVVSGGAPYILLLLKEDPTPEKRIESSSKVFFFLSACRKFQKSQIYGRSLGDSHSEL